MNKYKQKFVVSNILIKKKVIKMRFKKKKKEKKRKMYLIEHDFHVSFKPPLTRDWYDWKMVAEIPIIIKANYCDV